MARKIALITGATSGIGEGCARRFAQGGYNLIITGRNTGKLEILKQELEEEGVQVLALASTYATEKRLARLLTIFLRHGATSMS